MHVDYSEHGKVGHIYNIGNSVVLYAGLWAVFFTMFREKNGPKNNKDNKPMWSWEKWFVLIIYFGLWLPWIFSPRIMLFYHYMPALPALCIILARWLMPQLEGKKTIGAKLILAGAVFWMLLAYPFVTGLPMPKEISDFVYSLYSM